ncbi:MAG: hypothetical protein KatS3mg023_4020 [Armatimonadota bacterium]|nr:MAG: hypothetical protein KatS3mg023_4020 [Armatimonadota bacterium]GIV94474.1 MAG: hypothetical protein KatS3mg056_3183 [Chloroflexus sp.]
MPAVLTLELLPTTDQRYELRLELESDDQRHRPPQTFPCGPFDADALRALLGSDPDTYGAALGRALFADPQAVAKYCELRAAALNRNNSHAVSVQLILPAALQGLRWELLRDPVSGQPVGCDANAWWSRLLPVDHTTPTPPAPASVRRVLLAVADPVDAATYRLPAIDAAAYTNLLRGALDGWETTEISANWDAVRNQVYAGYDVLVLVAHGTLVDGQPWLFLVDAQQRVARRSGTDLVEMLKSLGERCPRLVVLISCAGAGDDDRQPLTALGPLLARSGPPAVIAAYGNLSLVTAARSLPILFRDLRLHGQIDRALNAARLAARQDGRSDWWALTLFSRLRTGRLWVSAPVHKPDNAPFFRGREDDNAAARQRSEQVPTIVEHTLDPNHPTTAISLNNLAECLRAQGDYAAARPLFEQALAILERTIGPDHPDTAHSLNTLASLLYAQGDYAAARPLFERALAIRERSLGPDHPATAISMNNLAECLRAQGDYAAARPLFEQALAILERTIGPDHPDTAHSLNTLAGLLYAQGDYAAACPLFERALAIRERSLGLDHPATAISMNNLAECLQAQGEYAAARPLYEQALAIFERTLGPDHPDTAHSLNTLAGLLYAQGDYAAARPLFERALAIRERSLGPSH